MILGYYTKGHTIIYKESEFPLVYSLCLKDIKSGDITKTYVYESREEAYDSLTLWLEMFIPSKLQSMTKFADYFYDNTLLMWFTPHDLSLMYNVPVYPYVEEIRWDSFKSQESQ